MDRAAFNEKEKILPLQNQARKERFAAAGNGCAWLRMAAHGCGWLKEMQKIRVKIEGFREDVRNFRAEFLERCPFGSRWAQPIDSQIFMTLRRLSGSFPDVSLTR